MNFNVQVLVPLLSSDILSARNPLNKKNLKQYYSDLCDSIEGFDRNFAIFVAGTYSRKLVHQQIEQLLEKYPEGTIQPPLFGTPVGIKDIIHCDNYQTRCGSDLPSHLFQEREAISVSRLKSAGAVMMGKTATTEFAYFSPASTRNPHNVLHTPGGSSSGSAAGVAANFFEYALGTQTVGSMIRPASFCGVVAFKPSLGRIPTQGVVPFSRTVDTIGVFSHSVVSLKKIIPVLISDWNQNLSNKKMTIGIPVGPYLDQANPVCLKIFNDFVSQTLCAHYDVVKIPMLQDIMAINTRHNQLIAAEFALEHEAWFREYRDYYKDVTRRLVCKGREITSPDRAKLAESCLELRQTIEDKMQQHGVDVMLSPSSVGEAPLGLSSTGDPVMNLPWTHAGLPAINIPYGKGPDQLPLGLQVIGKFKKDENLFALAIKIESYISAYS